MSVLWNQRKSSTGAKFDDLYIQMNLHTYGAMYSKIRFILFNLLSLFSVFSLISCFSEDVAKVQHFKSQNRDSRFFGK